MGVYHANFASADPRPTRPSNAITFGAADDTVAAAVATELANWTTGQRTSLTSRVGGLGYDLGAYVVGTRFTLNALVRADSGQVWRTRVRNAIDTVVPADIVAWLTGAAGAVDPDIVALSAPPAIPGSNAPITSVASQAMVQKI